MKRLKKHPLWREDVLTGLTESNRNYTKPEAHI